MIHMVYLFMSGCVVSNPRFCFLRRQPFSHPTAGQPFGVEGKENSCISHCELLVPPGSPDSVCEERCSRLRRANNMTESPCMAMSLCPLPLPRSSIPQPSEPAVYLPLVTILEHGVSAAMAARVVHWAKRSHPGVLVYDLKLTKQVGRRGTWTDADTALETAFTTLSPLDVQIERACELLEEEGALADGFAMLAFGQAGLVARGIVQLCPEVPARVLATYDSPHGGDYGGEASASVYQERTAPCLRAGTNRRFVVPPFRSS